MTKWTIWTLSLGHFCGPKNGKFVVVVVVVFLGFFICNQGQRISQQDFMLLVLSAP